MMRVILPTWGWGIVGRSQLSEYHQMERLSSAWVLTVQFFAGGFPQWTKNWACPVQGNRGPWRGKVTLPYNHRSKTLSLFPSLLHKDHFTTAIIYYAILQPLFTISCIICTLHYSSHFNTPSIILCALFLCTILLNSRILLTIWNTLKLDTNIDSWTNTPTQYSTNTHREWCYIG